MTVHRDGNSWLTKLEHISMLARTDHKLVFNNIGHLIDQELLRKQYNEIDGSKAVGIDGITKKEYGNKLEVNIAKLIANIRKDKYQPKPARIVLIPKEDGGSRPLVISCFEDKIVQSAVSKILESIYEPIFLPYSYGFRPGTNAHEALRELNKLTYGFRNGAIVEIDIRKYFNTIPHKALKDFLGKRISDRKFLRLVQRLIEAPIIEKDTMTTNKEGCPQGSIISPVLANIYLHYVIDCWFQEISKQHLRAKAGMVRFYKTLPKRLNKYGLSIHEGKSQIIKSGSNQAAKAAAKGEKLKSYNFLGFTCYWGKSWKGKQWRLKYTSRKDRFTDKLKGLRKYLRKHMHNPHKAQVLSTTIKVTKGWINYHAISDNEKRVSSFIYHSKRIIFKWLNRMGGKKRMNWKRFSKILQKISFPEKWTTVSMFPKPNKM
jgi:RNA-directed DNA polymerase